MNQLDLDYLNLVRDILENGTQKKTRNGEVLSVFGRTIKYSFKDGKFPLLTTKKMAWKTMVTELLWFLRGDTNIKYLVDNNCNIWNGDCYQSYLKQWNKNSFGFTPNEYFSPSEHEATPFTQEQFINKIKTDDEFAKKWGELGPIYGKQWRDWNSSEAEFEGLGGIDQIANVINLLKTDPDSRRMIVNAYNVGELDHMVLPPCHMMFQFYTRELSLEERVVIFNKKKESGEVVVPEFKSVGDMSAWTNKLLDEVIPKRAISLQWTQRSIDVGLGLPFNIASYALLLEIIAKEINMVPEDLIGNLGDCHIYNNHIDGLKEQLTRVPYELPKLKIEDEVVWTEYECLPSYSIKDFILENYQSHPSIKLPLSN